MLILDVMESSCAMFFTCQAERVHILTWGGKGKTVPADCTQCGGDSVFSWCVFTLVSIETVRDTAQFYQMGVSVDMPLINSVANDLL